ncbi:MAG: metal-dependent hydrolase [Nevskia sp.]|nr:metal-dependent hydrolase [Nevskia sp.]
MQTLAQHPMDNFPVRPLQFDLSSVGKRDLVWSRTCPEFAVFMNALGLHVPHFERYLIHALRQAKEQVQNPQLRRDIAAIIGQEAHHAKNFLQVNQALATRYPQVARFDAQAKRYFGARAKSDPLKRLVGFTAGYETFTFLAGIILLQNYQRWFEDSDPVMKAIWVWHQVEEVEHGAVAFDVYKNLYGRYEWYRKWMVLAALTHIGGETIKTYVHMARIEGWLRNPFRAVAKLSFCGVMLMRLLNSALPVFRRSYHPRRHPVVTSQQNPIQMAWRRYEHNGGDVLAIDHHKMAQIMGIDPA